MNQNGHKLSVNFIDKTLKQETKLTIMLVGCGWSDKHQYHKHASNQLEAIKMGTKATSVATASKLGSDLAKIIHRLGYY